MIEIGFVGWRGMVGSVLIDRMKAEGDFEKGHHYRFFSTSQKGMQGPDVKSGTTILQDAHDIAVLAKNAIIISCQGGGYTKEIYSKLRAYGWDGYWIDAASTKRMDDDSIIVLSPINRHQIDQALEAGIKNYIGGNCTVSLLLMAMNGLYQAGLVEWVDVKSYQAYSGAGAAVMQYFVQQMYALGNDLHAINDKPFNKWNILELDRHVSDLLASPKFNDQYGFPLAANLTPWIDTKVEDGLGKTREEWKAQAETNKILGFEDNPIPIDGLCVRVGTMRAHSQAVTVQLKENIELERLEKLLIDSSPWTKVIKNEPDETKVKLTPAFVSDSMNIHVGRIRHLHGENSGRYTFFTVGDQLLWGAAEPLRCALNQILKNLEISI